MVAPARQAKCEKTRLRLRLRGAVQGVGFRPFAYRLAARYELAGFVHNDSEGVLIEVEGANVANFVDALRHELPPLARLDSLESERLALHGDEIFVIETTQGGLARTRIPADAATCEKCLDDLFDPASRFHLYPFVNCTHCGPRYTLTRRLPYDRAQTSMARFPVCVDCTRDFVDPLDRRFHAEPVACPKCGPRLSHEPREIVAALREGKIVAVKGIGGFHLLDARPSAIEGAELLHGTLIGGLAEWIAAAAAPGEKIARGGGCMMNRILAEGLADRLREKGFAPLLARKIPPNDGGLSLGQAALARAVLSETARGEMAICA